MDKIEIILAKNKLEQGKHIVSAYDVMYITLMDYHKNRTGYFTDNSESVNTNIYNSKKEYNSRDLSKLS